MGGWGKWRAGVPSHRETPPHRLPCAPDFFGLHVRLLRIPHPPHAGTRHRAAAGPRRLLLALRPPDPRPLRGDVRDRPGGRADQHRDPGLHRPPGRPDADERSPRRVPACAAGTDRHGAARRHRPTAGAPGRQPCSQQRGRAGCDQPDPLAEPLARRAAELAVLPERLRRPNRQPRHADRQCGARVRGLEHPRHLVHRHLRHQRTRADGLRRLAARRPDRPVGDGLHVFSRLLRAAHARPLEGLVGAALARDGAGRRQLHQHPHGQAVRPVQRRGRLRARGDRRPHRGDRRPHAAHHAFHADALDHERAAPFLA